MVDSSFIRSILINIGVNSNSITSLDGKYSIPTMDWVLDTSFSLSSQINNILGEWVEESRDCDDFALSTMSLMRLFHSYKNPKSSLSVGYFQYTQDTGGVHAINVAIVENSEVLFFEPQSGRQLRLTTKEIKSCSRLLM